MTAIERLRFFDGEYLRSADWEAEQDYHIAMRRRLNVKLHLYGIVEGLRLVVDADSAPGATFFSISPGMAIDQLGREVVLEAPYVFRPEVDLARQGLSPGKHDVWLCYRESATTPPAAGYRVCNENNQNTRWQESFEVVLAMQGATAGTKIEAGDPDRSRGGVRIGWIRSAPPPAASFTEVGNENRHYVGIRAQRVVAPSGDAAGFDILADSPTEETLTVEPITFVGKHLIVGNDFSVDDTEVAGVDPHPKDVLKDVGSGVVKIESALFVKGTTWVREDSKWYSLRDYVQRLVPDVQVGNKSFETAATINSAVSTDTFKFPITTLLSGARRAQIMVGITGMTRRSLTAMSAWAVTIDPGLEWVVDVKATIANVSGNEFEASVTWQIAPKDQPPDPADAVLTITNLSISYVAIFYP